MEFELTAGGERHTVRLEGRGRSATITIGDRSYEVDWAEVREGVLSMIVDGRSHAAYVAERDGGLSVRVDGRRVLVGTGARDEAVSGAPGSARSAGGAIRAPMPGTVVKTLVSEGDRVSSGQSVVIVEAMKMENEVRSPIDGVVRSVNVSAGDSVGTTESMVEIEPSESAG